MGLQKAAVAEGYVNAKPNKWDLGSPKGLYFFLHDKWKEIYFEGYGI